MIVPWTWIFVLIWVCFLFFTSSSPTLERCCILVKTENQVDVRTQRQIDVNLQRWTDVVFWLKMKIGLTSEPNVWLTSISNVGQTLYFGWKWKSGWRQNPTSDWRQSPTLDRRCILVENENQVDVRTQRQIDINLQRWTDVVFWLKKNIRLTSEPKVKLISISNIVQTLHYIPIENGHYHICHQPVNTKGRGVKCPNN